MTEEKIIMKAIIVTDQAAGTAGMKLVERPEPPAAINDVIVQIRASGFVPTERRCSKYPESRLPDRWCRVGSRRWR
jgi:hypothetical protein